MTQSPPQDLQCTTLIVDLCWKKDSLSREEYVRPIERIAREFGPVTCKHMLDVSAEDALQHSHVILCGTALADNAFANHLEAFGWLAECKTPVLGICAGMQAIGVAHHAHIVPSKEIGMGRITLFRDDPLFAHPQSHVPIQAGAAHSLATHTVAAHSLDVYSLHGNCLAASLPEFDVLARSNLCVQAIKHKTLPHYGILFHPEVRNEHVVRNFLSMHSR